MQIQLETIQLHNSYKFINWTLQHILYNSKQSFIYDFQPIITDASQIILPNVTR